jgi:ATP-binding cassette subfamily B protein
MNHIRRLLPYVWPYWRFSVAALGLLLAVVVMDLAIPRLIQRLIDLGIRQHNPSVVVHTALLMLAISALSALFAIGNNYFSVRVGESVARDVREAMFIKIQAFSFSSLDRFTTGKLMVRLSSDVVAFQRLVQVSLRIGTRAPLLMLGSLALMVSTGPRLALILLPVLLVTSVVIVVFSLRMEPLFRAAQQKLDRLNTVLQENIVGARLVKAFVRAGFETERFEVANRDFAERSIAAMQFMSAMTPVLTVFVNLGLVIVVWAGGLEAIRGELSVGQIVAFTNYLLTTMTPLIMMTMLSNVWANGIASAQRVNEVLDEVSEISDSPAARPLSPDAPGHVSFEHASFHYNGADSGLVLQDVNLAARPGETVAILGATGAGKSTLINLIPRFYDVTAGRVCVADHDVRDLQQASLLDHVALVPQETILFTGTVRDNIRYGRPEASEADVVAAARAAQAHDFILQLPQGYDTQVAERGVNLSGGQKQRLAIARALLTRPRILILDDSTSSVDVETETRLQAALDRHEHGRTTFVVAQRISTVLTADRIAVLDRGRLVAHGTHADLMRTSRVYLEIYASQLGDGFEPEPQAPAREAAHD